jgi:hypothetical protein
VSVGLVAAVAAVVSYTHMHTLAVRAGEDWRAWIEPLSVDGLLIGASLVLYARRRAGVLAWSSVVIGILVSLAANLAAARPDLLSRLVAAWPALALALSYEVLLTLVRGRLDENEKGTQIVSTPGGPQPVGPVGVPVGTEPDRSGEWSGTVGERSDDELLTELRAMATAAGSTPTLTAVRTGLRVGTGRARRLLDQLAT